MAQDLTSGFDMLVQLSEHELNSQLATAFLGGTIFPPSLSVPVSGGGVTGTADLNFQTPVIDLDRPRPRIGLTVPFSGSELELTAPVPLTVAPLGGTILIVAAVEIATGASAQACVINFADSAPDVTVAFDAASQAELAPLLAVTGQSLAQAQNFVAGMVLEQLQTSIGRIMLTPWIPVADDTDPTTIFDLDVTTINDTSAADRDCLAFGVRMSSDAGGNIGGVTANLIPAGSETLVMMSNFWLLSKVMRPIVASALGLPVTDFDTPLRLNRPVPAPGGTGTLTDLEAAVAGNRIQVTGRATASGTGWSAVSTFSFFVSLSIDSTGSIAISTTTPVVNTDAELEWWVWLLSLGLGALFGGIVGVIIAAIVLAITQSVVDGVADGLISSGISGSLGSLPSIPLGPIGAGLQMSAIVLDDLELRGSIVRAPGVPVRNQGSRESAAGLSFDLDSGTVSALPVTGTDLVWDPANGLSVRGAARLTVTGIPYGALDAVGIAGLPLAGTAVSLSMIPVGFSLPFFGLPPSVAIGLRTGEGRLAKARAYRDLANGLALHLDWLTYDNPVPQLDISALWSVAERGPVSEYIGADCSRCTSSEVRWCGEFEAWPRLMAFPIDCQWCLCGEILTEGDGEVETPDGPVSYVLSGRTLHIEGDLGQSIDCQLCVSAIDARGRELFTCITLAQPGTQTVCVPCRPRLRPVAVAAVPPELASWRPVFALPAAAPAGDAPGQTAEPVIG